MSKLTKRTKLSQDAKPLNNDFPSEAFCYDDDISNEAVEVLKEKNAAKIGAETWKHIDGFGNLVAS